MCKTFLNTFKIKSPVTMSVAATRITLSLFYTMCANNWRVELNRKSKCMIKYGTILPQNVPQYPNLSSSNSPAHHLRFFFFWGDTVTKTKPKLRNTRVQINPSNSFIYHQQQMKERKEEKKKLTMISYQSTPLHVISPNIPNASLLVTCCQFCTKIKPHHKTFPSQ